MSKLDKEDEKKIEAIIKEKVLLDAVIAYYIEKKDFNEITSQLEITPAEFQKYLSDNNYPHVFAAELNVIREKLETRLLELVEEHDEIEKRMMTRQEQVEKLEKLSAKKLRLEEIEREKAKLEEELKAAGITDEQIKEKAPRYRDALKAVPKLEAVKEERFSGQPDYRASLKPPEKDDTKMDDLRRIARRSKSDEMGSLTQILFMPSWRKVLGSDEDSKFKGYYLNQPVHEILQDSVVILPDFYVTGLEKTMNEPFIFLTGLGIYFVKFRLTPGEIITDYREITGFVLPMSVYDKARDISASTIISDKLLMTEYMTSIPFSLIFQEQTAQMYIRGVVARNVVHPHKECFDTLLEVCKDKKSFNVDEGLKILSGGLSTKIPLYTNELLTEKELGDYSKLTAGLKNSQPKLGKILDDLQIKRDMKSQIFMQIKALKEDYVDIGYPKLLDWVP
ncbi:MAG: hypothetical protein ACFFD4_11915 [Candidatus Odinarchaeota archaeon]